MHVKIAYIALASSLAVIAGCPTFVGDCDYGACDRDAADSAADNAVDTPPGCSPSADPKDSPACVADSVGVFVDATNGKDSNAGTKEAPMQTIAAALGKTGALKRLYVCEGTGVTLILITPRFESAGVARVV